MPIPERLSKKAIGIIGGSGINSLVVGNRPEQKKVTTKYGDVLVDAVELDDAMVFFICRHGVHHTLPPHKINYRANIAAFQHLGVSAIVATNAVGSIEAQFEPGYFAVPDQVLDYSYGREHTFFDTFSEGISHVDFSYPFSRPLRDILNDVLSSESVSHCSHGTYACTQGPRLESAAEIQRIKNDGGTMVGMTLMPEAALAREQNIPYVSLCFSVNWAAGVDQGVISMDEIKGYLGKMSDAFIFLIPMVIEEISVLNFPLSHKNCM